MSKNMTTKVVVAVEGTNKDWAVYIESDYTREHGNTAEVIALYGHKLKKEVAEALFPDWAANRTYRP